MNENEKVICPNCNESNESDDTYCVNCKNRLNYDSLEATQEEKQTKELGLLKYNLTVSIYYNELLLTIKN